jgi:nitrite reductase/ring-hydroxylating ferredoxin subunit
VSLVSLSLSPTPPPLTIESNNSTSTMLAATTRSPTAARAAAASRGRAPAVTVVAAFTSVGATLSDVKAAGGKKVVETSSGRVLLAEDGGVLFAVSNKCSHLGLPLVGKTALLQGEVANGCVTCPAHKTRFSLSTGEVQGEWCPSFPQLPLVGKLGDKKPLPTYAVRVSDSGAIEVDL